MTRIIIREALSTDHDDIIGFYDEFHDDHVMLRSETVVKNAIRNGTFFLAIDINATNGGRICAASAVYDVNVELPGGGTIPLKEAGGSNVKPERRGLGIHKIMHAARAMHEFILDRGGFQEYFGAIIVPNENSVKNILRMGFEKWENVPESLRNERAPYAENGNEIAYYHLLENALPIHAKILIDAAEHGILEHRSSTLEQAELVMDVETIRRYSPILRRVANGDFSDLK